MNSGQESQGSVLTGSAIALFIQLVCGIVTFVIATIWPTAPGSGSNFSGFIVLWIWGLTQWIGVIPTALYFRNRGQRETMIGLLIAGGVGLLLNSACDGLVLGWFRR